MIDKQKEEEFYSKEFSFSYSSLNRLLFSPSLFYKDYILQDREIKTDKYLVEGKLVHCLVFEPDNLDSKFNVVPGKAPSDNVRKVLKHLSTVTVSEKLFDVSNEDILNTLKEFNLYQSLKLDDARIAKIKVDDFEPYWKFLSNSNVDVIDQETLAKCTDYAEIIKSNTDVMELFASTQTDFDLDPVHTYAEKYLECNLKDKPFGLKGYIDFYKIDSDEKLVTICDLKTTSKSISDFKDTIDFYNYWLQAAIYCKMVYENLDEEQKDFNIIYKFAVIDSYKQVYVFDVSSETLSMWTEGLREVLDVAEYHYTERKYSLPYEFLAKKVIL
jgi:hypothetical protein